MTHTPILTAADHEHFLEHGIVIIKNVADTAALRDALAGFEGKSYTGTVGAADYKPVQPEGLPRCYGPRFAAALSELFGEPHAISPKFAGGDMPRPHEPEKAATWKLEYAHTDDDYPTPMPAGWALGSFLFLTPVKPRGGGFIYFEGAYRRYRQIMSHNPWALKKDASDPIYSGPPTEFLAEPGDLLLFHHLGGHTGSTNVADPTTRHALLSRHHPANRVVPGSKPFEQMSTIEKANSTRYLRHRFGDSYVLPKFVVNAETDRAFHTGFSGDGGRLLTVAPYHFAGKAWLFYVQSDNPSRVRVRSSDDWVRWHGESAIDTGLASVDDVSFYQRERTVYFAASGQGGTAVFASEDFAEWRVVAKLTDVAGLCGHYSTDYGTKVASGFYALTRRTGTSSVTANWAKTFPDALAASQNTLSCSAPEGTRLAGFTTAPTLGEGMFAMVLDVVAGNGVSEPFVMRGSDSVVFAAPPVPLAFDCPTPPRHIRVYHRARDYWLVTFMRSDAGSERMFWGVIDWSVSPLKLTEVRDSASMRGAMEIVGLF